MSRRRREAGQSGHQAAERQAAGPPDTERPAPRPGFPARFFAHAAILIAVFAIVSAIAELAGAANLGVSLGIGSIAFAIALVAVIVTD